MHTPSSAIGDLSAPAQHDSCRGRRAV